MKSAFKYFGLLILGISLFSCTDVVDLDVEAAPPELVVDGLLSNDRDLYIKLSQTSGFFDNSAFEPIRGARVSIYENGQETDILTESTDTPGTYRSNFKGNIGNQYQLRIEINNNAPEQILGTWWSTADSMKRVPTIDSLGQMSLDRNTIPQAFFPGEYAVMYFGDFEGVGDYYRVSRMLNDSVFAQENFFITDENFDGFYFGGGLFPPIAIFGPFEEPEVGEEADSLSVRLESVSEEFFDYMQVLNTQVQTGSPFDAPPALVLGNIYRDGNPNDYGFGYFRVVAASENGIRYTP